MKYHMKYQDKSQAVENACFAIRPKVKELRSASSMFSDIVLKKGYFDLKDQDDNKIARVLKADFKASSREILDKCINDECKRYKVKPDYVVKILEIDELFATIEDLLPTDEDI
jgi:hypothetical protein